MEPGKRSLVPFFLISVSLHLVFLFSWPSPVEKRHPEETIPVSLVAPPEKKKPTLVEKVKEPPTRPSKAPAEIAKKSTPLPEEIAKAPFEVVENEKPTERVEDRPVREKQSIVQRPLPTMRELLPPVTWSPSEGKTGSKEGAVRLDTREPKYITYFASIKRAIELVWEYPEPALRYGLEGKLVLEFTILADGTLGVTRLLRSSGFPVLDQEAMRAVRAASPFHPIPPWIGKTRLDIIASFEYHDNRVKYGLTP